MASPDPTFETIADIISETASVDRAKIAPEAHVINDLGIDSLDFLDIVFEIDKRFGIKVPVEAWTEQVNSGKAPAEQFFVMGSLARRIDELVAFARPASSRPSGRLNGPVLEHVAHPPGHAESRLDFRRASRRAGGRARVPAR